jgi:hypothetical protein
MLKVYTARAMTGRTGLELVQGSADILNAAPSGVEILDPVTIEGVQPTSEPLRGDPVTLPEHWRRDKQCIRDAHVIFDITGPAKSEGVAHEIGYARFCLWKPVVRLYPGLGASIARLEDDVIVGSLEEGFRVIDEKWGTRAKRVAWRLAMLNRCLLRWVGYQLAEFK